MIGISRPINGSSVDSREASNADYRRRQALVGGESLRQTLPLSQQDIGHIVNARWVHAAGPEQAGQGQFDDFLGLAHHVGPAATLEQDVECAQPGARALQVIRCQVPITDYAPSFQYGWPWAIARITRPWAMARRTPASSAAMRSNGSNHTSPSTAASHQTAPGSMPDGGGCTKCASIA